MRSDPELGKNVWISNVEGVLKAVTSLKARLSMNKDYEDQLSALIKANASVEEIHREFLDSIQHSVLFFWLRIGLAWILLVANFLPRSSPKSLRRKFCWIWSPRPNIQLWPRASHKGTNILKMHGPFDFPDKREIDLKAQLCNAL